MTSVAIGPRTETALKEIKRLEVARAQAAEEETELAREVAGHQSKLDVARAQGLVTKVNHDQVRAFESELKELRGKLAKARSTLAGVDQMLAEKRQALEEAKVTDAQEALTTREMDVALRGLEKNAKALEKARAAFLTTLEVSAAALLEEIAPHRAQWEKLIEERRGLYSQRQRALGPEASPFESPYYRMQKDPLACRPFGDPGDVPEAAKLAKLLEPLLGK